MSETKTKPTKQRQPRVRGRILAVTPDHDYWIELRKDGLHVRQFRRSRSWHVAIHDLISTAIGQRLLPL